MDCCAVENTAMIAAGYLVKSKNLLEIPPSLVGDIPGLI